MTTSCPSKKDPVNSFIHSSIFHLLILNSQDILEDSSRVNFLSVDFIDYNGFLVTGFFTDFEILDCCSFGGWIFAFSLFYYLLLPSFPRSSFLPDLLRMSDDFMRCRIPNPLVMVNFICQFGWAMGPRYLVGHFPDVLGGCFWMRLASPLSLSLPQVLAPPLSRASSTLRPPYRSTGSSVELGSSPGLTSCLGRGFSDSETFLSTGAWKAVLCHGSRQRRDGSSPPANPRCQFLPYIH